MITDKNLKIKNDLQQIADMLLLNGTLTECFGLIHGKMGIVIFFFLYAQYTNNMLYADYAYDLIIEIQSQLHVNSQADYEKGIAGIGVGIDYLIQNIFLDIEDNFFEDMDQGMIRTVLYDPWRNFSLYDGLTGYGRYWISRLRHNPLQAQECLLYITERIEEKNLDIPQEEQTDVYCFLHDLNKITDFNVSATLIQKYERQSVDINPNFSRLGDFLVGNITRIYHCSQYFKDFFNYDIDKALKQISNLDKLPPVKMGLLTGYAGEGLLRLAVLDPTKISWAQLL